jgi:disulfide oxidoreductase YuzD
LIINLSSIDAEKNTKYNLALEIKNIWELNNVYVYPLVISEEAVVTKKIPKISRKYRFNQKHFKNGAKSSTNAKV